MSNPVFHFSRPEGFTVHVNNVAETVTRRKLLELFNSLIGDISKCDELFDNGRRYYALAFLTQDAAKKALCMSGYNVDGVPLAVTAASPPPPQRASKHSRPADNRRNLYVLGLPFDLTKAEFAEIFSHYGTVCHAVILATVDNASRRRGFVVLNRHEEAKLAMDALNRKEIKGHVIDVSWAVVQRSEGFLDGGDRMTMLSSQPPSPSPASFDTNTATPAPASLQVPIIVTPPAEYTPPPELPVQSACLVVKNLPALLFSQIADLHPLLGPFGDIKKLEMLAPRADDPTHRSAVVEYANTMQASEACQSLQGQVYSSSRLTVEFVGTNATLDVDPKHGLNPRAPPFVVHPSFASDDSVAYPRHSGSYASAFSKGPLDNSLTPLLHVPLASTPRPSSAPTEWSSQQRWNLLTGQWQDYVAHRFSTPSSPVLRSAQLA